MTLQKQRYLIGHRPQLHNDAKASIASPAVHFLRAAAPWCRWGVLAEVHTSPDRWSDALSYGLEATRLQRMGIDDALVVECEVRVHEGALGIGVTAADNSTFVCHERVVGADAGQTTARLYVRDLRSANRVLFRNVAGGNRATRFDLLNLSAHTKPNGRFFQTSWSQGGGVIPVSELRRALTWSQDVWDTPFRPAEVRPSTGVITIVDVDALPGHLAADSSPNLPSGYWDKPLTQWKMEVDDAPILEWLWRWFSPRRHFEFGTWEGFGATLVARATEADIWTVNLPEGETGTDGSSLYAATDSGSFIGRLYRESGYASRVHQLLSDSRQLDLQSLGTGIFDSILIDGGHTPDVVTSDTDKALQALRPGGLCVWHDFCPEPEVLAANLAPLGVVQAIAENFDRWSSAFEQIFWIRKSWILVGIARR